MSDRTTVCVVICVCDLLLLKTRFYPEFLVDWKVLKTSDEKYLFFFPSFDCFLLKYWDVCLEVGIIPELNFIKFLTSETLPNNIQRFFLALLVAFVYYLSNFKKFISQSHCSFFLHWLINYTLAVLMNSDLLYHYWNKNDGGGKEIKCESGHLVGLLCCTHSSQRGRTGQTFCPVLLVLHPRSWMVKVIMNYHMTCSHGVWRYECSHYSWLLISEHVIFVL